MSAHVCASVPASCSFDESVCMYVCRVSHYVVPECSSVENTMRLQRIHMMQVMEYVVWFVNFGT